MQTYGNWDIQELPLSSPYFYTQLEQFLASNGLRMEKLDRYLTVQADGRILAGAGLYRDIIKCVAVAQEARSEGLVAPLVSRLIAEAAASGIHNLKVFTKPENRAIFESLGFRLLAQAPKAVLMENGKGLERYCEYLKGFRRPGRNGVIVMNANPLTIGHKYLIDKASEQVDNLYIIPVKEDLSQFSYAERLEMIKAVVAGPAASENYFFGRCQKNQFTEAIANPTHATTSNVTVLEGSDYIISAATFPTYFLKDLSDASDTQMLLDLDLYSRWIAPALDASVRFVGSEPLDALTAKYNTLIPNAVIIPRLEMASAGPAASENYFSGRYPKSQFPEAIANPTHADAISASKVRKALEEGSFREAAEMCPESTWPYLLGQLAERALRMELDTPMKPGLVCPDSCGAHRDMDYALMLKGISAIRPFFPKMALAASADGLRRLGIEAEEAMMKATGGVNTHRGAIFAFGLALNARGDSERMAELAKGICGSNRTPGARSMALDGYKMLFEDWLPFYRTEKDIIKTLLRIMSTLEDTCVIKRVGNEKAQIVKQEASARLTAVVAGPTAEENYFFGRCQKNQFSSANANPAHATTASYAEAFLREMCARYAQEGISPGGAADMLALTIFIDSIIV